MTARRNAIAITWAFLLSGAVLAQATTPNPQQSTSGAGVVSLIGCVERLPATSARATTPPAYKLIDVQPGTMTRMSTKPESQFLLVPSRTLTTPIDLGKLQNQRVEITGTIMPTPPDKVSPQAKPGETVPQNLPTLMMTALKVISTECK
jgi:hypothetical protein